MFFRPKRLKNLGRPKNFWGCLKKKEKGRRKNLGLRKKILGPLKIWGFLKRKKVVKKTWGHVSIKMTTLDISRRYVD